MVDPRDYKKSPELRALLQFAGAITVPAEY
jgi:hypothetical protein